MAFFVLALFVIEWTFILGIIYALTILLPALAGLL